MRKCTHLSQKGQRLLVELLRVSDIAVDDRLERQSGVLAMLVEVVAQFFCPQRDRTADCVLRFLDVLVHALVAEDAVRGVACLARSRVLRARKEGRAI
jgi:hypothetical protein